MPGDLELVSEWRHFGGWMRQYAHESAAVGGLKMTFNVYLPPQAETGPVPVIYYLAGLTCTGETGAQKGHFAKAAAQRGVAIVYPDTSPRGAGVAGEDDDWDFGTGAGFYVDATQQPWSKHYRMYTYVREELPALVTEHLPIRKGKAGIFGHSMGGHGALTLAMRNTDKYASVSAFAPICNPLEVPWGVKALKGYLGDDRATRAEYDATNLMVRMMAVPKSWYNFVDQGKADKFLDQQQLTPHVLQEACEKKGQSMQLRIHEGYDHSYYFVSSFGEEHINFHADAL
ncbi:putative esterase, partial [Tribonema minus]